MYRLDLQDKSAVVTGGASGIGEASARQLSALGAKCVIADLNEELGQKVATEVGGIFVKWDVTSEEDGAAVFEAANEAIFQRVIDINLVGSFNMLRLCASAMAKTEPDEDGQKGAIVNMASVAAFDGQIGQNSYSASKGGVVGMTLPIARDLAAAGIRVNTIAPGLIDTPIYGTGEQSDQFKAHLGQSVLFPPRLGSGDELASMVMELITNPYMNGETIRVDGGIRMPPK